MAITAPSGSAELRAENVSAAVKGFALQQYKLKQVCLVVNSTADKETYYREDAADLTGRTGASIADVPRGTNFPQVGVTETEYSGVHKKYAAEDYILIEDQNRSAVDIQARAMIRIARAVAKAVDTAIYAGLIAASGIGTAAAVATWNNATESLQKPVEDILKGIQNMDENNYDALENGYLLLNPKDYRSLMNNSKVINNPSFKTADVVSNGRVGQICGLTIIKSNSVTADEALIIIGQRAATWYNSSDLQTVTIPDPGIKITMRSWERGFVAVTDPLAIYRITNTAD